MTRQIISGRGMVFKAISGLRNHGVPLEDSGSALLRRGLRSSPFDPLWRPKVPLASVVDDTTVQEHVDDVPVIFIQHADDLICLALLLTSLSSP
jgi:hypothetical protein